MDEELIIRNIMKLNKIYNDYINEGKYSYAVDVHDEITKWERELTEKRRLVNMDKFSFDHDGCLYVKVEDHA